MLRLSQKDVDVLRLLAANEHPDVNSAHRLRLELLGLVSDGPRGLCLTPAGRRAATEEANIEHETIERKPQRVDAAGRRRMLERNTDFL